MSQSSEITRREFHLGAGSVLLSSFVVPIASEPSLANDVGAREDRAMTAAACDFQSSFMTWNLPPQPNLPPNSRHNIPYGNMARIQLDALIDVIDRITGKSERFVLIAPCRTEWVYAEERLFQLPSGEYRNVYSLTHERRMVRRLTHRKSKPARAGLVSDQFRDLKIDVRTHDVSRTLTSAAEIVKAIPENGPLVGRTQIDDPSGTVRYVLEYPIKTMNFQPKSNSFQVDTGPILVPDFSSKLESSIDRLEMAHVAYNRLDRAEFIIRRPTAVKDDQGKELCQVQHYSEVREDKAVNVILAAGRRR